MNASSNDLRQRAVAAYDAREGTQQGHRTMNC